MPGPTRHPADLVGTPVFWSTVGVTSVAGVLFVLFPERRVWMGCAVLLMWGCFFAANAVRSRRTHSAISSPIYFLAAAVMAGSGAGLLEVQLWMVWALGAGIVAANLAERVVGRYL